MSFEMGVCVCVFALLALAWLLLSICKSKTYRINASNCEIQLNQIDWQAHKSKLFGCNESSSSACPLPVLLPLLLLLYCISCKAQSAHNSFYNPSASANFLSKHKLETTWDFTFCCLALKQGQQTRSYVYRNLHLFAIILGGWILFNILLGEVSHTHTHTLAQTHITTMNLFMEWKKSFNLSKQASKPSQETKE